MNAYDRSICIFITVASSCIGGVVSCLTDAFLGCAVGIGWGCTLLAIWGIVRSDDA